MDEYLHKSRYVALSVEWKCRNVLLPGWPEIQAARSSLPSAMMAVRAIIQSRLGRRRRRLRPLLRLRRRPDRPLH